MDTITHGIVGALTGKAFFAGQDVPAGSRSGQISSAQSFATARAAILACSWGSVFPDIDVFAGPLARNPLAIMEWHRNITHSLVMLPFWAAVLATVSVPLARWFRLTRPSFPRLFVIYAAGLATHVFLDLVTSFGTMVWSPLNFSRPAWDLIFIIDLILTSIALVPQVAAWCYREPGKVILRGGVVWAALTGGSFGGFALASTAGYGFPIWVVGIVSAIFALVIFVPTIQDFGFRWSRASWCRVGLALLCVYLAAAFVMHRKALANVDDFVAAHHLPAENRAALPLPPTFTHWAGLISTSEGVWRTTFRLPGGATERAQLYSDDQSDPYVEEAKKLRAIQVYLWFARFPIWQVERLEEQTIVSISDVRFIRDGDPDANASGQQRVRIPGIRINPTGNTFEVVFDANRRVVSSGFRRARP